MRYFIVSMLLFVTCPQVGANPTLREIAENQGYGYKYANLVLLSKIIKNFELQTGALHVYARLSF